MKFIIIISNVFIVFLFTANLVAAKPLYYKDFILGDSKKNVLLILKQKYSRYQIYYESNDRFINGIKVKAENSIRIIIKKYMEKEEVLLAFDSDNILFEIFTKKTPSDLRDFINLKILLTEIYGKPADYDTVKDTHILFWNFEKKKYYAYLIFDSSRDDLIISLRDEYLNIKYDPVNKE
jgi:hypothetical protein